MTGQSRLQPAHRRGRTAASTDSSGSRIPIYTKEFAADPHTAYRRMRLRYGALAPVDIAPGVPATLVIGYRTALRILDDTTQFPSDPRAWQQKAPAGLPIVPMMQWRPNALRSTGADHERYRGVVVEALAGVDLIALRTRVARAAVPLINRFCADGSADLIDRYVVPLVFEVLNGILGCPPDLGDQLMHGLGPILDMRTDEEAETLARKALVELIAGRRAEPGDDVTSRLIRHPADLSDDELAHQLLGLFWTGVEPPRNLIANTLLLILTDPRFSANQIGFAPPVRAALDEVLATDPPLANHCITYPPLPVLIDDIWLPADQPVLIGLAACNNDPERTVGTLSTPETGLAWGTGVHACPAHARSIAGLIAEEAIDQLLDALPDLRPAFDPEQAVWRPGPFQRALTALPVEFPPTPGMRIF
ncbi:cytochrome P450 [Nocardia sp. NPDC024068]|uniref:cytochrome P450 n=1 Tax=Nocardia sp. NPDC024068 TaxID=3157197 RepID=UPI0033CA3A6B